MSKARDTLRTAPAAAITLQRGDAPGAVSADAAKLSRMSGETGLVATPPGSIPSCRRNTNARKPSGRSIPAALMEGERPDTTRTFDRGVHGAAHSGQEFQVMVEKNSGHRCGSSVCRSSRGKRYELSVQSFNTPREPYRIDYRSDPSIRRYPYHAGARPMQHLRTRRKIIRNCYSPEKPLLSMAHARFLSSCREDRAPCETMSRRTED